LENYTGNVITSEVNALRYVILTKAEEHMPYGELVGTTKSVMIQLGCRTNRGRYN
jgi:hypothetical protein